MQGYNFYSYDDVLGYQFVRTVTERRQDPSRITDESIMNLARKVLGMHVDFEKILVVPISSDMGSTQCLSDTLPFFEGKGAE
jgi:hypothetical protein